MISGDVIDWYDNVIMVCECLFKIYVLVLVVEKFVLVLLEFDLFGNEEVLQCLFIEVCEFVGEWLEQFDEWVKELSLCIEDVLLFGIEEYWE